VTWRVPKSVGHGFTCATGHDDDHDPRDEDCDRHKKKDDKKKDGKKKDGKKKDGKKKGGKKKGGGHR